MTTITIRCFRNGEFGDVESPTTLYRDLFNSAFTRHTVKTEREAIAKLCRSTDSDFYIHLGNRNKFKQPNCPRTRE